MRSAIIQGSLEKVKVILSEGYPIDFPVNDANTRALHLACNRGETDILRYLIAQGAKINERDKKNWTPLMLAASGGKVECTLVLLQEKNIDVTAKDNDGKDALKFAEERLVDVRMMSHGAESENYERIIASIKKKMQISN